MSKQTQTQTQTPKPAQPVEDRERVDAYNKQAMEIAQGYMALSWDGDIPSDTAMRESGEKCDELLLKLLAEVREDERSRCTQAPQTKCAWRECTEVVEEQGDFCSQCCQTAAFDRSAKHSE